MSEWASGWMVSAKLVVWLIFVTTYWISGRKWRVLRWLGGLVFAGGIIGIGLLFHEWHILSILAVVTYPAALTNGYSGDDGPVKLRRRAIYGLLLGASSVCFVSTSALWLVMLAQTALAVLSSVVFGVLNPFKDAPSEEAAIAACSTVLVPMMS